MIDSQVLPVQVSQYEKTLVEGFNKGDSSVVYKVFHPDCVIHINGGPERDLSLDQFKKMVSGLFIAFPDLHFIIEDQFNVGEKFGTRWTATGTNTGPFGPMEPTGKTIAIEGLIIDYVTDGKVAKRWELWDQLAMMQQLGIS